MKLQFLSLFVISWSLADDRIEVIINEPMISGKNCSKWIDCQRLQLSKLKPQNESSIQQQFERILENGEMGCNQKQIFDKHCDFRKKLREKRERRRQKDEKRPKIGKRKFINAADRGQYFKFQPHHYRTENGKIESVKKKRSVNIPNSLEQCMTIACLCKFFTGIQTNSCTYKGYPVERVIRKEYHMMTDDERNRFNNAIKVMYTNGTFRQFALYHLSGTVFGSAQNGPAFLLWHRELMKRFELELRRIDPRIYLPYWNPEMSKYEGIFVKDCVTFSPGFMDKVGRMRAEPVINRFFDEKLLEKILSENRLDYFFNFPQKPQNPNCTMPVKYLDDYIENYHGTVQTNIEGDMVYTFSSASDPLFYLHYSFVDSIWEKWRLKWQTRDQRATEYPSDDQVAACATKFHMFNARLEPFGNMAVGDALANSYTDELYGYADWPECNTEKTNCGSPYIFCDLTAAPRCMVKIVIGGRCIQFQNGEQPCLNGICQNGICIPKLADLGKEK